jgi:ATP-dependent RNA helicase RhlE
LTQFTNIDARNPISAGAETTHLPASAGSAGAPAEGGFAALGLAEPILKAVAAEGYTTPTPIQRQAIPVIHAGHDLLGIAQTGTGKTAAFVLPMLERLAADRRPAKPRTCRMLVLAPTRELAAQIADAVKTYGRHQRPSVAVVVGGVRPGPQIRDLARGVDILVATPGRLLDHMGTNAVRLDEATVAVLDEADQMLDLGFMPAIRRIMARLPAKRQTMLFSATMPDPIRKLASDFLHEPREIRVAPAAKPVDAVEQRVILVDAKAKRATLARLLGQPEVTRAIVFTRTKHGADRVTRHLDAAGIAAVAIHGNKSQPQRERALDAFRDGKIRVLVATDIAARGIDVDGISHVINFELPNVPESYVHRIGRTARAGAAGIAIALCDPAERPLLRDIERLIGRALPKEGSHEGGSDTGQSDRRVAPRGRSQTRGTGNSGRPQGKPKAHSQARPHGKPKRHAAQPAERHRNGQNRRDDARATEAPVREPKRNHPNGDRPLSRNRHGEARPGNEAEDAGLARMLGVTRAA